MNLSQIREYFRVLSGRFDLTDENSGFMADFHINSASQFLDRRSEIQKTWASHYVFAEIGDWFVQFPHCRSVKEVWISSQTARWQLEKKNLQDVLSEYFTELVSLLDTGVPVYYSPAITRYIPEGTVLHPDVASFTDVISTTGYGYNAILFAPPTDARLLVEVVGLFYSVALVDDKDENFWSAIHPSLLIKAALREVEVFNRNSNGVKDWEAAITTDLSTINFDLVEELIAEVDQMEG